jgi:preprotein translocase subunit YajC
LIFSANAPLAQTTVPSTSQPTSAPAPVGGFGDFFKSPLFFPIILIGVFLIFSSRNRKNADRKVKDMLGNLKKGDRVQTIGGILGTVVEARDTEVVLKVDETNNTKMRFSRKAIHVVLQDEPDKKTP